MISEYEIDLLTSNKSFSEEYQNKIKKTFSTNEGILLLKLLKENCGSDKAYEHILGIMRKTLENKYIEKLERFELLQSIKIIMKEFINLRKYYKNNESYEIILYHCFICEIFDTSKMKQLKTNDFIGIIKEFINLRKDCQDNKVYFSILLYIFAEGVLDLPKLKNLEKDELLKIIRIFKRKFVDLVNKYRNDDESGRTLCFGFAYGILNDSEIEKLEINDLLKVIEVLINLRKECQDNETYYCILHIGLPYIILKNPKIKQIEINELLEVIKIFGKQMINLRKNYRDYEIYLHILEKKFVPQILNILEIKQIEINELLRFIDIFQKIFSNLKNTEGENIMAIYFLTEKILFELKDKNHEEKIKILITFFNKQIRNSKDKIKIIERLGNFNQNQIISYILLYYLKYRQKSLVNFIQNVDIVNELKLDININFLEKSIKPLTEMNEKELKLVFLENQDKKTNLENFYKEICSKLNYQNEKELKQLEKSIYQAKLKFEKEEFDDSLYKNYLKPLTNIFANLILNYFDNLKKDKIENKFIQDFNLEKINYELVDENFLEVYKMYSSNRLTKNKEIAFNLLKNYLKGNCYPQKSLLKSYPYNLENNLNWVKNQFGSSFFGVLKARRFFSENREEFLVEESSNKDKKEAEIKNLQHHLGVSNGILKKYEIEVFENYELLVKYFSNEKNIENLKEKINENDFNDLELQVNSIKKILSSKTKKEISKISIYLELDPIKICLMGNRVDGSCLSFYNSINNYWSVFSNMVDMNKLVFYIEDDFKNIVGRVLCCFNTYKTLVRFNLYSKGGIGEKYNLNKYFDDYIKKLAKKFGIKLSNELDIENLNCKNWYIDPVYEFKFD